MALFSDRDPGGGIREGAQRAGWLLLGATGLVALVVSLLPAPYVIDRPGPTYDTLGSVEVDGEEIPLIRLIDQPEYPEQAELRLTTVTRLGNPDNLPGWWEVLVAWLSSEQSVTPVDVAFPPGVSVEDNREAARIEMENSQQEAIAAALGYLEIDYSSFLEVAATLEGGPSEGVLREGDIVVEAAGQPVADVTELRAIIADNGVQRPLQLGITRDGAREIVEVIPRLSESEPAIPIIGVLVSGRYDFPIDVEIELGSVGGPSAGMIFALGMIEKLTEEQIAGASTIAGSGTITAAGEVGAVGGIRHKVYGAASAGADWFLIPRDNCADLAGIEIRGMPIVPVSTLSEAMDTLDQIAADQPVARCAD